MRAVAAAALFGAVFLWCGTGYAQSSAPEDGADEPASVPDTDSQDKPTLAVSGYLQFFFKDRFEASGDHSTEPSVFRIQRARIIFKGKVNRYVGYDVEVDPRSPQISGVLRDAFISLKVIPHQEFRIGQQKTQFGYENPESSTRLYTVNRSEVSDNLSRGVTLRDIGLGLVGKVPLGGGFSFEDAVTVVNGAGSNVQADDTHRKNTWGRIGARYERKRLKVRLGVSGATGDQVEPADPGPPPTPEFEFSFRRLGADVEVDHTWGFLAAEYVKGRDRAPATVPGAGGDHDGYYVILVGKTPWKVGPLARYDVLDDFRRWTYGAFWGLPSDTVRVLLNYEIFRDADGKHDDRMYLWTQIRFKQKDEKRTKAAPKGTS